MAQPSSTVTSASIVVVLYAAALAVVGTRYPAAWLILGVDTVTSSATLFAYRSDKLAAQRGRQRTAEKTLHLLALAGGWPGALVAQRMYQHKTRKTSFQIVFWITVVANIGLTAGLIGVFW